MFIESLKAIGGEKLMSEVITLYHGTIADFEMTSNRADHARISGRGSTAPKPVAKQLGWRLETTILSLRKSKRKD
jgi:hypothetical protein